MLVPELNLSRDIAITLDSVSQVIEYTGDGEETREIVYTLSFTVQGYLFGPTTDAWLIKKAIVNVYNGFSKGEQYLTLTRADGFGDFRDDEELYVGDNYQTSPGHSRVLNWSNTNLSLTTYMTTGIGAVAGDTIRGLESGAHFVVNTSNLTNLKMVRSTSVPNPLNVDAANVANGNWTAVTTVEEFPNINE